MKPCHEFMLEAGPRPCTILCFNVHTTVEYLDRNAVSIRQLLQHISKSIVVCARPRQKMLTKIYRKLSSFITIALINCAYMSIEASKFVRDIQGAAWLH